jgi:hypothetical protein
MVLQRTVLFNLYDLDATKKVSAAELRKIAVAFMQPPGASEKQIKQFEKQFGAMITALAFFALRNYAREDDKCLNFNEWRRYAADDDALLKFIKQTNAMAATLKSDAAIIASKTKTKPKSESKTAII